MDFKVRIDLLKQKMPTPKFRAAYGQWTTPAWYVRSLVEAGQGVTDAVRFVVRECALEPADVAERSIRQAFYSCKDKPWPADLQLPGHGTIEDDDYEV